MEPYAGEVSQLQRMQKMAGQTWPPEGPGVETLANRLQGTDQVLEGCERLLETIGHKIHGEGLGKDVNKAVAKPAGLSALCMDINSKAQRIHEALEALNIFLE